MNGDQYFVIWPDGQKFGPADVATLQRWAVENRIGPATLLESAINGHHVRAADIPDLRSVLPVNMPGPGGQTHYPPPDAFIPSNPSSGTAEVTVAWILGGLGLLCCGVYPAVGGLICAIFAHNKNQPNAVAAMIFNVVVIVMSVTIGGIFSYFTGF